jgi:putative ATPase
VLLERALGDPERGYGDRRVELSPEAADHLLDVAGGDARSLLNALELAVETTEPTPSPGAGKDDPGVIRIDLAIAEQSIQQRAVLYDKQGDAHFDTISAFIKSLRGSDADAALFWLARMVEAGENPRFIFRRMLIAAGEDVGLADPRAIVVVEACAAAFERVGLPEGLYPLAQAALYLAGAEKSNSVLGFFDALKTVRATSRQEMPSHLRDASRDGKAFGDGVGYRYPHAYSDHWVAQQYLPSALQGEVFWQPGALGWEGSLRNRLQLRRGAQLAAVAEHALDQGPLLSSGPDDPALTRWLQRQAGAEGQRLDRLRQRFWQGTTWHRQDRVLILQARSLLWALDPLAATPEGGVVITVSTPGDRERLAAQLELLDSLRQPRLLLVPPDQPQQLRAQLEEGERFEHIAGRSPFRGLRPADLQEWLGVVDVLAGAAAELRLLCSDPLLGPAGALAEQGGGDNAAGELLERVRRLEEPWLRAASDQRHLKAELKTRAWSIREDTWQEGLGLQLTPSVLQRWLGASTPYRTLLEERLEPDQLQAMERMLNAALGTTLPQHLGHTLLIARHPGARP